MEWHVTIAADERRALCTSDRGRTLAARAIARAGGGELLLFCVADDHLHLVVRGERRRAGQVVGNVAQALRRVVDAPLEPARVRPVRSKNHLANLVPYVLDQSRHHALATAGHPATWPGSCFADLVGARLLPGFTADPLRESLPRLTARALWGAVGLEPLEPAADVVLAELGLRALCAASARSAALPDLQGRSRTAVQARRLVVGLARRLGVPRDAVREALRLPERTARRLARGAPPPEHERVLRSWIAIRLATSVRDGTA